MLTPEQEQAIADAVGAAEAGTAAEILVVISPEVSNYREVPLSWAAAIALLLPPIAVVAGLEPLKLATQGGLWIAGQAQALEGEFTFALTLYAVAQALLFLIVYALCEIPLVRRALTPSILKRHRVERLARQQLAAFGARAIGSPAGVLIFVAATDRQVRVLPSPSAEGPVDKAAWSSAADAIGAGMKAHGSLARGIVEAVGICGEALKTSFPPDGGPHAFSNHPVDL